MKEVIMGLWFAVLIGYAYLAWLLMEQHDREGRQRIWAIIFTSLFCTLLLQVEIYKECYLDSFWTWAYWSTVGGALLVVYLAPTILWLARGPFTEQEAVEYSLLKDLRPNLFVWHGDGSVTQNPDYQKQRQAWQRLSDNWTNRRTEVYTIDSE